MESQEENDREMDLYIEQMIDGWILHWEQEEKQ